MSLILKEEKNTVKNNYAPSSPRNKLTWREIKDLIEKSGVNDADEIDEIDISWGNAKNFKCEKDEDFGWKIHLG